MTSIFSLLFQLHKRIESLQQQNRVLKCELETYKLRVKSLQEVKIILTSKIAIIVFKNIKFEFWRLKLLDFKSIF